MLAPPPAEFSTARRFKPARQPNFTAAGQKQVGGAAEGSGQTTWCSRSSWRWGFPGLTTAPQLLPAFRSNSWTGLFSLCRTPLHGWSSKLVVGTTFSGRYCADYTGFEVRMPERVWFRLAVLVYRIDVKKTFSTFSNVFFEQKKNVRKRRKRFFFAQRFYFKKRA